MEEQLHQDVTTFSTHYWTWVRGLAEGVLEEVLQHPVVVQMLVANPQLCLADGLALWQQRN